LVDEASLLARAAYVDLNWIRATMAETLESSDHTSVQRRIEAAVQEKLTDASGVSDPRQRPADAMLSPVLLDERDGSIGPCESLLPDRCSDKGFLPISVADYLELLDWTARQLAPGKRGKTPASFPAVLKRLGLSAADWCELTSDFGKLFGTVAGRSDCVDDLRSHRTHRRYYLRRRARELMLAG